MRCVSLLLVGSFASGCGDARSRADPASARATNVVMGVESAADVLANVLGLDFLVFERLAKRNERGDLEGRLAESWEPSGDYTEWTVRLRPDVRWQEVRPGARALFWRTDQPVFRAPRVRRALTLAIDRPELARLLHLPPEFPITDGPLTERQLYRGELSEPLAYDPQESLRLLDAAGSTDSDGDGLRQRLGRPFRFTATVWRGNGMPELAVCVQDYLRRVGVEMSAAGSRVDFAGTYVDEMWVEEPSDGDREES